MKTCLSALMIALLSASIAFAGEKNPAAEKEWLRQALAKETQRATESQKHHGNSERFEQKFGWIKDKQPQKFAALMSANKKAESAWAAVARKCKSAESPEELSALKGTAHAAAADAYLAEVALKYAGAEQQRKEMADKTGNNTVKSLAKQLDANERAMLDAHRAKNDASAALQKLEMRNRDLNSQLRTAYEKARAEKHAGEHPAHKKK